MKHKKKEEIEGLFSPALLCYALHSDWRIVKAGLGAIQGVPAFGDCPDACSHKSACI